MIFNIENRTIYFALWYAYILNHCISKESVVIDLQLFKMSWLITNSFAQIAIITVLILLLLAVLIQIKFSYWARTGFPYIKPMFPFGNLRNDG